eukprot:TRINITY_DN2255_c0_g1_i2.p1 TRINITY_DN2255_c0_g1~~TRINITY_DN2255_c0_g1_i2.p1  ORF type:complete len:293 (+),score=39.69 TRINITY_DN2255_c0_g1_i2:61-939(+)
MALLEMTRRHIRKVLESMREQVPFTERVEGKRFDLVTSSVVDTLCRVEWGTPGDAEGILQRMEYIVRTLLNSSCLKSSSSNKDLQGCLHEFREKLPTVDLKLKSTRSEDGAEGILKIAGGNKKNKNQVYRSQTISFILHNMKIQRDKECLKKLLPQGKIDTPDNSEWSRIQGTWTIKMFYYSCAGELVETKRCSVIWLYFHRWEKEISLPPQLASLPFDALDRFLPDVDVMLEPDHGTFMKRCAEWQKEVTPYVFDNLNLFPFAVFCTRGDHGPRSVQDRYRQANPEAGERS